MAGGDRLERVEIENTRTGERRAVDTPAVFTVVGAVPRTNWLPPEVETDTRGFIRTGRALAGSPYWTRAREAYLLETSQPGVFAGGDVRVDSVKRVSSAAGEGAMSVKFMHAHLAEAMH
jgi:thioredoxin reductase (NADPH)